MSPASPRMHEAPKDAAKGAEPSMEEILASIRRIIADDQAIGYGSGGRARPAPALPPEDEVEPDEIKARDESTVVPLAAQRASGDIVPPRRGEPSPTAFERVAEFVLANSAADAPAKSRGGEPPAKVAMGPQKPAAQPSRAEPAADQLLSPAADASIASAFDALSTTVVSRTPRTLEDMVCDMMRPMLRAWLDDNLPSLVERLVRAEIERVARGGRR